MDRRKIILVVTTDLNFDQRLIRMGNALMVMGYDVTILGREFDHSPPLRPRKYKQYRLNCWFKKGFMAYAEFNIRVFFYLIFRKFDFATANDIDTIMGTFYGTVFKNTIRVFDAHEWFVEVPELQHKPKVKRFWQRIENKFVPRFDRHYTVAQTLATQFNNQFKKTFTVIRNIGEIKDEPEIIIQPKEPFMLYQGAVNEGRGLKELIECMPNISTKLKIAGEGDILHELKNQVEKLELKDKVEFLGRVTPKELKGITPQASLGLNLLENRSLNYYYSLANKFFDYAFAGIPQISMNFPEYSLLNNRCEVAVLVDNLERDSLTQAINDLLQNETLRKRLIENSKVMKASMNWNHESDKLREVYY